MHLTSTIAAQTHLRVSPPAAAKGSKHARNSMAVDMIQQWPCDIQQLLSARETAAVLKFQSLKFHLSYDFYVGKNWTYCP